VRFNYGSRASLGLEGGRVIEEPFAGAGGWRFNVSWQLKMKR
jgi:hypothetical protein